MRLVSEFKLHKNTTIFKINIFKLINKHPKHPTNDKSSVTLRFLKNCFKGIKQIRKENSIEFG